MGVAGQEIAALPRPYGWAAAAWAWKLASYALTSSGAAVMISRFSAFFPSAALVKLKEPVRIVALSITMILLWAMVCWSSIRVWMPAFTKKVAALYWSV